MVAGGAGGVGIGSSPFNLAGLSGTTPTQAGFQPQAPQLMMAGSVLAGQVHPQPQAQAPVMSGVPSYIQVSQPPQQIPNQYTGPAPIYVQAQPQQGNVHYVQQQPPPPPGYVNPQQPQRTQPPPPVYYYPSGSCLRYT